MLRGAANVALKYPESQVCMCRPAKSSIVFNVEDALTFLRDRERERDCDNTQTKKTRGLARIKGEISCQNSSH